VVEAHESCLGLNESGPTKTFRKAFTEVFLPLREMIIRGCGAAFVTAVIALCLNHAVGAQAVHHCAGAAIEQASKLLTFHFGPDSRIEVATSVKALAPIRNPADKAQRLDVLEVWGHIYKGQYRMRFIYAQLPNECVLMGQEILEYASL
jgi:hypothetical protein